MLAVAVALCAAILSSVAYTTVRGLRETDDPLVVVFYFPLVATPAAVPFMITKAVWPTPFEWLLLVGVGVVTQIGQIFLTKGLHRERAGRATSMSYIQVVFAATWGLLFFHEVPNSLSIVGAVLILCGMLVVSRVRLGALSMNRTVKTVK
jgi:drug/metabolite transporter (DMT)-like permease